jgi:hypothetical protein
MYKRGGGVLSMMLVRLMISVMTSWKMCCSAMIQSARRTRGLVLTSMNVDSII